MLQLIQAIPFSFAALFPVLNPLGSALIFLTLTAGLADHERAKLAWKVGFNTFFLLTIVLLTGSWILRFFGITIPVVQVGGGLVVAYIGWHLLNKPDDGKVIDGEATYDFKKAEGLAFYPLTMPITAGPGCIAVTLTIGAHEMSKSMPDTLWSESGAIIGIFLASLVVFLSYRYASRLTSKLGESGTQVIMKLAAFINLCIGIQIMWHGIQGLAILLL